MTTSVLNQTFIANMRQLWRLDPRLAQRIDDLPPDASLAIEPSRSGPPTARFVQPDGRAHYLHSRHHPAGEALDFCRGLEGGDATAVVLSGLGLGYHVKAIREVFGGETLAIVCEPDPVTIKTALEQVDFSRELEAGRLEFLTQTDASYVHERLARHNTDLALGTIFAAPPASRVVSPEFHAAARQAVLDYASFLKMSIVTLLHNSAITCRNIAANFPTYLATPPADILRNRFRGHPAILVAAGPSLGRNVDQLRGLEDRAIIIAAQTTLRLLLARGIRPHFVTSLDFSDLSRQFFEGLEMPEDLILVAEPKATWHVIDVFRGEPGAREKHPDDRRGDQAAAVDMAPRVNSSAAAQATPSPQPSPSREREPDVPLRRVILLDNDFAHRCLGERLARRTPMPAGATVMHLSFYLAQWLGCDPIIFIGQDLGFSGHCYYTPGVAIHRAWQSEQGRYCTLEMKEWERIGRHRPILRQATDVHGAPIYTDDQMFTYLQQFERDFARSPARVIDATEGGVRKAGAAVMTLAEAISLHCNSRIAADRFHYDRSPWYQSAPLAAGQAALRERLAELATFRGICQETMRIIGRLEGLTDRPSEFNRLIARVDELRTLVQEHGTIFRMVCGVSQRGELMKTSADRRMAIDAPRGREHTLRQLRRDRAFVEALLEGCGELQSILDQSLSRFEAELEPQTA